MVLVQAKQDSVLVCTKPVDNNNLNSLKGRGGRSPAFLLCVVILNLFQDPASLLKLQEVITPLLGGVKTLRTPVSIRVLVGDKIL
jgi:hypothetical protein